MTHLSRRTFMAGVSVAPFAASAASPKRRAEWMSGKWGVRFMTYGGETPGVANFDVAKIMAQIRQLDTIGWVMVNLTAGANGALYVSPHPVLEEHIHPNMAPSRDLFGELLDAIKAEGLRTLVYFASEGPAREKAVRFNQPHPLDKTVAGSREKWLAYAKSNGMTPIEATAKVIIEHYAKRYGKKIDAWWFDHARWGDPVLFAKAARTGNPDAACAFNLRKQGTVLRSTPEEDYTAGHPTPEKKQPFWWKGNETMIETIEAGPWIDGALGQIFIPLQEKWFGGKPDFPTDQAVDWTRRIVKAGGAITWAVAIEEPREEKSEFAATQFEQLKAIDAAVKAARAE